MNISGCLWQSCYQTLNETVVLWNTTIAAVENATAVQVIATNGTTSSLISTLALDIHVLVVVGALLAFVVVARAIYISRKPIRLEAEVSDPAPPADTYKVRTLTGNDRFTSRIIHTQCEDQVPFNLRPEGTSRTSNSLPNFSQATDFGCSALEQGNSIIERPGRPHSRPNREGGLNSLRNTTLESFLKSYESDYAKHERHCVAAAQGDAEAAFAVAENYAHGCSGVLVNTERAYTYYKQAADKGHKNAQYEVGQCYQHGRGVNKDDQEAIRYYNLAVQQGHRMAKHELSYKYDYYGHHKPIHEMLVSLAQTGDGFAAYIVAGHYEEGYGVEKSPESAFTYYKQAADKGHKQAQYEVGRCYQHGRGVNKNDQEAIRYYKLAAQQGHEMAEHELN